MIKQNLETRNIINPINLKPMKDLINKLKSTKQLNLSDKIDPVITTKLFSIQIEF